MMDLQESLKLFPMLSIDVPAIDRGGLVSDLIALSDRRAIYHWSALQLADKREKPIHEFIIGLTTKVPTLYIFEDLFLSASALSRSEQEALYQSLIDLFALINRLRNGCSFVFLNSPQNGPPDRIEGIFDYYTLPLPTHAQVAQVLKDKGFLISSDSKIFSIVAGLSIEEVRKGLSGCSVDQSQEELETSLQAYKYGVLARAGIEFMDSTETADIGGLDQVKKYLDRVSFGFGAIASHAGIKPPRGCLLVGVPGTGKTYFAKIAAKRLGFSLVSVGIDVAVSRGVAELKLLLMRLEALPNCIIYFDEIDKFLAGEDSAKFLALFLTWTSEKTGKNLVIATANRLERLPPEATRAGRFDVVFFVDSPHGAARQEIMQLHCSKYDDRFERDYGPFSIDEWIELIEASVEFVGSELALAVDQAAQDVCAKLAAEERLTFKDGSLLLDGFLISRSQIPMDFSILLSKLCATVSLYEKNPSGIDLIRNVAGKMAVNATSENLGSPFTRPPINIHEVF